MGCGEKVPLKAHNATYEITYSGELMIGSPIQFQSSAPAGKKLLWQFSDGETSIETAPIHRFYKVSYSGGEIIDDTATLIVDNDIHQPNRIFFRLAPNVPRLIANFNWKGGKFTMHGNCCPGMTNHSLNDTVFRVSMENDMTLKAWGLQLPYLPDSNYYSNFRSASRYNAAWLIYTADTLFFRHTSGNADGWAETSYYHKF